MRFPIERLDTKTLLEIHACTKCGECTRYCLLCEIDYEELSDPKGKLILLKKMISTQTGLRARIFGKKEIGDEIYRELMTHMYKCTICGQCQVVCPANIQTMETWEELRNALFVEEGLAPMEVHRPFITSIMDFNNPWQQSPARRARWARKLKFDIEKYPFESDVDVLFFVGCTASYDANIRGMALSTAELMESAGIKFGILGEREICCGSTLLRVGARDEFREISEKNSRILNETGAETIVTACAGCFKTLKHDYKKFTSLDAEIIHAVQLMDELVEEGKITLKDTKLTVTYHDPCHLGRHSRVFEPQRNLMSNLGLELKEMDRCKKMSRCCGAGGGVKSAFPDISIKGSENRVSDAIRTGAELLLTSCPFCYQSLKDASVKTGKIETRDLLEILAENLKK